VSARLHLPNRRYSATTKIRHGDAATAYHVTVGISPSGQVLEVFAHGARIGSAMDAILDDACILLSLLYQYGADPISLAARFARSDESAIARIARVAASEVDVEAPWPEPERQE